MNSKKIILLSCAVLCIFAVSPAMAQMRGHSASMPVMSSMRSTVSAARMPMQHTPMVNSSAGFHRFNDFHGRFHHHNRVIIIDNFGFPFFVSFPYYYPYPYPYPCPYGYYGNPYGGY